MKRVLWIVWSFLTLGVIFYAGNTLLRAEDKSVMLIGETSHGHHQIELECSACHGDPFGGPEVMQDACVNCHGEELDLSQDSHPKKKFTDPREALRLEKIDARYCITCHQEHVPEQTHPMGVTVPEDVCYHCHSEIGEERESHQDLAFNTCASAGCHNFHDNTALYESFLAKHADEPWLKAIASLPAVTPNPTVDERAVSVNSSKFPVQIANHPDIADEWSASLHAKNGIDCGGCHVPAGSETWINKPSFESCANCHTQEVAGFTQGMHGMRAHPALDHSSREDRPELISPKESKGDFLASARGAVHGCQSCHGAHSERPKFAAAEACLSCHNDEHSLSYETSPHAQLRDGSSNAHEHVTCATCHLPVQKNKDGSLFVQHNQNANLRPNEKMLRDVCMHCHGLEFALNSLADRQLIKNNFTGQPGTKIDSVNWAKKRDTEHEPP